MAAHVLTGSKQEIAQKVAGMEGNVRKAIVFIEESTAHAGGAEDIFAEMKAFTVQQTSADDSRESIYQRQEGE